MSEIAVSRASRIFQKRFPDAVLNSKRGLNIVSTSCTRSHTATTKQNNLIKRYAENLTKIDQYKKKSRTHHRCVTINYDDRYGLMTNSSIKLIDIITNLINLIK